MTRRSLRREDLQSSRYNPGPSDGLRSLSVQEAICLIRRQAGRLSRIQIALEEVQQVIKAPSPDELRQIEEGARPLSIEAYVIARLQAAILLWKAPKKTFDTPSLKGQFRGWSNLDRKDVSLIRAALEALSAGNIRTRGEGKQEARPYRRDS